MLTFSLKLGKSLDFLKETSWEDVIVYIESFLDAKVAIK